MATPFPLRRVLAPAFSFAVILSLLSSCAVSQGLVLKKDGSASATLHLESSKPFLDYVLGVADVIGMKELARQGRIYDLPTIQKGLEARPGISVSRIASPSPEVLDIELFFPSVTDAFAMDATLKGAGFFSLTETGGKKTMRLRLDGENFKQLAVFFPILANPMFSGMGPQAGGGTSEQDYLAMMEYAMGSEGPAAIRKSAIELTVKVEGEILSQTGGSLSGGAAVFRIPLVRFLLLDKPIDLSVTYR
jgi:hypothetical protein